MAISQTHDRSIGRLAESYVRSRRNEMTAISVGAGIRAVRSLAGNPPHSDRELADIIAKAALFHGKAVEFDRPSS